MEPIGLYTACNDRMLPFLPAWLGARDTYNRDAPVFVIPFDENVKELRSFCEKRSVPMLEGTVSDWRRIGASIYGSSQYRTNVSRASYFSKLAAFNGPLQRFVFSDVNSLILFDVNRAFGNLRSDMCRFFTVARRFRTVGSREALRLYRSINPKFRTGYNAFLFFSVKDFVTLDDAEAAMRHKDFSADNFGPAPEQSLLSWLEVALEKEFGLIRDSCPELNRGRRRGVLTIADGKVTDARGKRVHVLKWTGAAFGPDMAHWPIVEHFRARHTSELTTGAPSAFARKVASI